MLYRKSKRSGPNVDLSPLIDVVFLLLIFFMVSTTFRDDHGMDLNLPQANSQSSAKSDNLKVAINVEEKIFVGGNEVEKSRLFREIETLLADQSSKTVVLQVDSAVPHGLVAEVMNIAMSAGAQGLTIATAEKKDQDP